MGDEEDEKDKLVEMLYSLIKKEKSNIDPSPAKEEKDNKESIKEKIEDSTKKEDHANREKDLEPSVAGKTKEIFKLLSDTDSDEMNENDKTSETKQIDKFENSDLGVEKEIKK